jgi:2-desacetyl-2-hydroxyethyl bacteriochlorophyllide A dehydrogenase
VATHRRAVFEGPGRLRLAEDVSRELSRGEVRVRVQAAGICGSDVHGYRGTNARRQPGVVMGHEIAGEVLEAANDADQQVGVAVAVNPALTCGTCRYCRAGQDNLCRDRRLYGCAVDLPGAFADEVIVPQSSLVPLSGQISFDWAALVEPLSVGSHAVGLLPTRRGSAIVVLGGGMIGIGAALAATRVGVERVLVSEPLITRRAVLDSLGIESMVPSADELQRGLFDAAIDCVASASSLATAMRAVRASGEIIVVGLAEARVEVDIELLVVGEHSLKGSFNYSHEEFADTARWVSSGELDLDPVIQNRVSLAEVPAVFEAYASGRLDALKTVVQPTRDSE